VVLIYAGVGVIVARRQPRNPIGWILLISIALLLFSTAVGSYAALYYRLGHHELPLPSAAADGRLAARWPRRQQLKWLASGAAITLVLLAISFGVSSTSGAGEILSFGLAALPVGIGVGILCRSMPPSRWPSPRWPPSRCSIRCGSACST
jgi:peptidoglycan/LPS O-acetylase OafA/YrhL